VTQITLIRYLAIVLGTVLWDVGAVLQKRAVSRMPAGGLPVLALVRSPGWMLGLLVTTAGWGMFVFGLDRVPISAARTITAGSYVVLALFSTVFLRAPLSFAEWLSLAGVTLGIVLLGLQESAASAPTVPSAGILILGVVCVTSLSVLVLLALRLFKGSSRAAVARLFSFAALSGLLGSVGDLLTKVFLAIVQAAHPVPALPAILAAAGLISFYVTGFYMLSRAYQVGTVVGGVVVSDFFGRVGALFLGSLVLSEPLGGPGQAGLLRALGFLLVLGGSLFLGRFAAGAGKRPEGPSQEKAR
jgi:multidrug transporter EmrE-like cation transporter